jgi:hypothetical protein
MNDQTNRDKNKEVEMYNEALKEINARRFVGYTMIFVSLIGLLWMLPVDFKKVWKIFSLESQTKTMYEQNHIYHFKLDKNVDYNPFVYMDSSLKENDCKIFFNLLKDNGVDKTDYISGKKIKENILLFKEVVFNYKTEVFYNWFSELIHNVNEKYGFELSGFFEPIKFVTLNENNFIEWNNTYKDGYDSSRKFTVIVDFSNPKKYEGGDIEVFHDGVISMPRSQCSILVFPSFMSYKISTITKGQKNIALFYINGPKFR